MYLGSINTEKNFRSRLSTPSGTASHPLHNEVQWLWPPQPGGLSGHAHAHPPGVPRLPGSPAGFQRSGPWSAALPRGLHGNGLGGPLEPGTWTSQEVGPPRRPSVAETHTRASAHHPGERGVGLSGSVHLVTGSLLSFLRIQWVLSIHPPPGRRQCESTARPWRKR